MKIKALFTDEARAAAAASRLKRVAEKLEMGPFQIFAVRLGTGFGWQLRKFGGITLASGTQCYSSGAAARAAGQLARTGQET